MSHAPDSGPLPSPETIRACEASLAGLRAGLGRVLIGQDQVIESTMIALLSRGHVLLEGLPGLGKTELVKGLAQLLDLDFRRVQFTPDLLPGDITGTNILEENQSGKRELVFRRGPIFGNLVLADEINRASPKTQAAMLEAMQERRVTVFGQTRDLPDPFFVLATQNPIELEGTYPLPEAQLDRFLFKILIKGINENALSEILMKRVRGLAPEQPALLGPNDLQQLFATCDRIHLPQAVAYYIARLVKASDPTSNNATTMVKRFVRFGGSPRAAIGMAAAGRAMALMNGRPAVGFDDIIAVTPAILRHRLVLSYEAGLEHVDADAVIADLVAGIERISRKAEAIEGQD